MTIRSRLPEIKAEIRKLVAEGHTLAYGLQFQNSFGKFEKSYRELAEDHKDTEEVIERVKKATNSFSEMYEKWYSEVGSIVRQIIPERLDDFIGFYSWKEARREISFENYRLKDAASGLTTRRGGAVVVHPPSAHIYLNQQVAILEACANRLDSKVADIQQLVFADLLDDEIDVAKTLLEHGFTRAAGAIIGVALERHLTFVCEARNMMITKRNPSISDYNDKLKSGEVIDTPIWRRISHIADIRNLCDHNKSREPSSTEVDEAISSTQGVIKTVF